MNAIGAVSAESKFGTVPQPRLVQAAHEFEAQLMKELLKPMTSGTSLDGEEADPGTGGALADFATEALGQGLSKRGGLGIATDILQNISRNEKDSRSFSNAGTIEKAPPNRGAVGLK